MSKNKDAIEPKRGGVANKLEILKNKSSGGQHGGTRLNTGRPK